MTDIGTFAGIGLALYTAHHVGDYWIQTDHQAACKGKKGMEGRVQCLAHVLTYTITQALFVFALLAVTGAPVNIYAVIAGLAVSGVTHYAADRREFGIMFRLARLLPGKENFLRLGVPRHGVRLDVFGPCPTCSGTGTAWDESTGGRCSDCYGGGELPGGTVGDNPSLGTGAWALDQSWHIAFGVFVPALIACI